MPCADTKFVISGPPMYYSENYPLEQKFLKRFEIRLPIMKLLPGGYEPPCSEGRDAGNLAIAVVDADCETAPEAPMENTRRKLGLLSG